MKASFVALSLLLPALVSAHAQNARHVQHARQAGSSSSAAAPAATTTSAAAAAPTTTPNAAAPATTTSAAGAVTGTVTSSVTSVSALPNVPFSLLSTNPNAVPLTEITIGASSMPTQALDTVYAAGAQPTYLPGAPALPNAALLVPSNYPTLDKSPDLTHPLVQQWIQDVKNSGITIPNIPVNNPGGCPNNTAAVAAAATNCWWTCGGCVRATDIATCPQKMTWGLTYDDGPSYHTPELMNYMDSQGIKGTFFVVGSRAISFPTTLQSQYMGGHQIAVHTWSHPALTTQTNEQIIAELGWSKKIIKDVLGVTPNMMRPPYGDIDDRVRAISQAMDLEPVIWTRINATATFDTSDYDIAGGTVSVSQVLENWEEIIGHAASMDTGFIVLEHDLFQQSVDVATGYILPDAQAHQFNIMPVVSCLNKPMKDAYIETNDNSTNPPALSGVAVTFSSGAPGSAQATGGSSAETVLPGMGLAGAIAGLAALIL